MHAIALPKNTLGRFPEIVLFALALILVNLPLLGGGYRESLVFLPERVRMGEWWRVALHGFVHLSWCHFLFDAGAFMLLYKDLEERNPLRRIGYVAACSLGSLLISSLTSPIVQTRGLCGLSGIAHGLMTISAIETMKRESRTRRLWLCGGTLSFAVVVLKSVIEVLQGRVFLDLLPFGLLNLLGTPIPESHAGGVLSGAVASLLFGSRAPSDHS